MADTLRGDWPRRSCIDCGKQGVTIRHWGPLAPTGVTIKNCAECWQERNIYYAKHGTPKPLPLQEFFAVTVSSHSRSVYRVNCGPPGHKPVVTKIALRGESGITIGRCLAGGSLVGITKAGLQLYDHGADFLGQERTRRERAEEVNEFFHGGHTSPVVALFLTRAGADDCFLTEDLMPSDLRWRQETEEVLKAIGDEHPVFIPSQGHFGLFGK